MTSISSNLATSVQSTAQTRALIENSGAKTPRLGEFQATRPAGNDAQELKQQFTQFVGEAFYGQMLKAMRSTVGKPAYFNGGRGEEVFQGQLDQQLATELTKSSADKFADPMFERQFPKLAKHAQPATLNDLGALPRR